MLKTKDGTTLATLAEGHYKGRIEMIPKGHFCLKKEIQLPLYLAHGQLYCDLMMHHPMVEWQMQAHGCCILDCEGGQDAFGFAITMSEAGLFGLTSKE